MVTFGSNVAADIVRGYYSRTQEIDDVLRTRHISRVQYELWRAQADAVGARGHHQMM